MKNIFISAFYALTVLCSTVAAAQTPVTIDTSHIYDGRLDTLQTSVVTASSRGNFLSKGKDLRTEVITAAGLCKMACCNLAESFENSASVTVGYSDAVTGARQIRLLGQNGIYTQMLDENRPVMRGIASPFGLNFVPSQWLESIQIAKGVTSVINGVESMTGQINMEHRKPTDEKPLYLQASIMDDTKADFNFTSSIQLDEEQKWSTVILGHLDGNFKEMDGNGDSFRDDPMQKQVSLSNRWLYFDPSGLQVRFGVRALYDSRDGGQMSTVQNRWETGIVNQNYGAYMKLGIPLNEENSSNVAMVADYTWYSMDGNFGKRRYEATQHSAFLNLLYQNQDLDQHHYTLGLSGTMDLYDESVLLPSSFTSRTNLSDFGAFGEYTFHSEDQTTFSAITGLRLDYYKEGGIKFSPRLTLKWAPSEDLVLRANGGRGLRYSCPLSDNIGVLSTGKTLSGEILNHVLEDCWTFGGNATYYFGESTYISLDFFRNAFTEQLLLGYGSNNNICFAPLSSIEGGYSYTNNIQADFSTEPVRGLTLTLTGRYTDARQTTPLQENDIKPMVSRYKGVFNAQYATRLNKWIFDFTASVNGPCKVWDFMKGLNGLYSSGETPVYPLLYCQVTKRFKGFDIYAGGENLTNYCQGSPILFAESPYSDNFDASCVWGPIMGIKLYAGIRLTIWKKE